MIRKPAGKITRRFLLAAGALLGIALLALLFFYILNPFRALRLVFPDITSISHLHADLRNDSVYTVVQVLATNRSPYRLVIDTIFAEIRLADTVLVRERTAPALDQRRFQSDTLRLPLRFSIKAFRATVASLAGKEKTELRVSFYIVYNTFAGRVKLPLEQTFTIDVPVLPEIKLLGIRNKKLDLKEKTFRATVLLEIINQGDLLDLRLDNLRYYFRAGDMLNSSGVIPGRVVIAPRSNRRLNVAVKLELERPVKSLWTALFKKPVNYDFVLKCNLEIDPPGNLTPRYLPVDITASGIIDPE